MRKLALLSFSFLLAACGGVDKPRRGADGGELARKDSPGEAAAFFVAQRAIDGGELPVERYAAALAKKAAMTPPEARLAAKLGQRAWELVGPPAVGGRTREILIDPTDTRVMYAASVSGGVFKSTDAGVQWRSTGDAFANLATASLAFDPDDTRTLYAGTGEGVYVNRPVTRSRGVRGDGVFVTSDAGATWRQLASTRGNLDFDYVNKLVFDADDRLYAATRTGIHVSTDRGETWTRRLAPPNGEGCAELAFVPTRNRLLASCGVFSQSAIYATEDGGATWRTTTLPPSSGRTTFAVAKSNPDIVYALTAHVTDYSLLVLQRSTDGGTTYSTVLDRSGDALSTLILSNPYASVDDDCDRFDGPPLGQGWFDNVIAVNPVNPDVVYVGGVDLFRSDDGGRTFRIASRWWLDAGTNLVHADQHVIRFDPNFDGAGNRRMWVGNDGGVFVTQDANAGTLATDICASSGGLAWAAQNTGYAVTQFYHGVVSVDGKTVLAGAQDNGSWLGTLTDDGAAAGWREVYGGDGAYAALDPRDRQRFYASSQGASFVRTDDGGRTFTQIRDGLPPAGSNYLFIHPLVIDPNNPDVLWTGAGPRVYRSVDRGGNWAAVSGALAPVTPVPSRLTAIDVFRGDSNRVVAGFEDGTVAVTADGQTFRSIVPRAGVVSSVAFDPADARRIHVTYSTFGGAHVFVSDDGGATYRGLDGDTPAFALPDVPAHVLRVDPRSRETLYLGTDIGLFVSRDGGERWVADASGLGNVLVEQLAFAPANGEPALFAFTYGRGAWRAKLSALDRASANPGYAGAWFEPATVGQGMQFEVIPETGQLTVGWYTFEAQAGTGGGAGHAWLIGAGTLRGEVATVPLFRVARGRFAANGAGATEPAGEVVIRFADCSNARADYVLREGATERRGEIALQRIGSARVCEAFRAQGDGALSTLATKAPAGTFELGHGGSWLASTAAAQGFVLDVDPANALAISSWYTFDPTDANASGEAPTWFTAQGSVSGATATLDVYRTLGGSFDAGGGTTTQKVGTLALTARSCSAIDAAYDVAMRDGSRRSGTFALTRVAAATLCEAMAP